MEFTDEYVHINSISSPLDAAGVGEVVINYDNNRAPYALVEVISATIHSDTDVNTTYVLTTQEIANNVRNTANKGTTLALIDYVAPLDTTGGADFLYQLIRQGAKALYSNSRVLHFYITNAQGGPTLGIIGGGVILGYNIVLKISRPVVGSVAPAYREQIPL
jgi:hypothetical protein